MGSFKKLIASAYINTRPDHYTVEFAGRNVRFIADDEYTKSWYYRNRLKRTFRGYNEPSLTLFVERLSSCKRSFLDVGAHLGYFSILFASVPGNEALAIELDPSNYRALVRAIEGQPDQMRSRIETLNVGIYDSHSAIELPRRRELDSSHQIEVSAEPQGDSVSVELVTIDELLRRSSFCPDLVKIDIEGFENHALRGASELLQKTRPMMLIEVHPKRLERLGESVSELFAITEAAGYRHFRFEDNRSRKGSLLTTDISTSSQQTWEAVCVHRDDQIGLSAIEEFLS